MPLQKLNCIELHNSESTNRKTFAKAASLRYCTFGIVMVQCIHIFMLQHVLYYLTSSMLQMRHRDNSSTALQYR